MTDLKAIKDDLVFGLDIGTRSIVGVVGYLSHQVFHVVAMAESMQQEQCLMDRFMIYIKSVIQYDG